MSIPEAGTSQVDIGEAARQLQLAGHDARVAFDCIDLGDLDTLLTIDVDRWKQEIGFREAHLAQFDGLPDEIWAAHRRVAKALDEA